MKFIINFASRPNEKSYAHYSDGEYDISNKINCPYKKVHENYIIRIIRILIDIHIALSRKNIRKYYIAEYIDIFNAKTEYHFDENIIEFTEHSLYRIHACGLELCHDFNETSF